MSLQVCADLNSGENPVSFLMTFEGVKGRKPVRTFVCYHTMRRRIYKDDLNHVYDQSSFGVESIGNSIQQYLFNTHYRLPNEPLRSQETVKLR